jgi:aldose 1-epimerase
MSRRAGAVGILIAMMTPITGKQYEIRAGDYAATVTQLGATLRTLTCGGIALVAGFDADELPPHGAGQLLAPWPNRVDHGTYSFDGATYHLALSEPAKENAIHGLTRYALWDVVTHEPASVHLQSRGHGTQGYPFAVQVDARYSLDAASGLAVTITAANVGSRPAPWGTAHHPYLVVANSRIDDCELTLPAAAWLPVDGRLIPISPPEDVAGTEFDFRVPRKLASTVLDHAFTSLSRDDHGLAWVRLEDGGVCTALWMDESYRWLQVFTSDPLEPERYRAAVAVEPMTCPPNAFASGTDRIRLEPGDSVTHRWGLRLGPAIPAGNPLR